MVVVDGASGLHQRQLPWHAWHMDDKSLEYGDGIGAVLVCLLLGSSVQHTKVGLICLNSSNFNAVDRVIHLSGAIVSSTALKCMLIRATLILQKQDQSLP